MNDSFRLRDFLTKKAYLNLQNAFILMSDDYSTYKLGEKDYIITIDEPCYQDGDPELPIRVPVKYEFIRDFLIPGINNIASNHVLDFAEGVLKKSLFTKALKEGYALTLKDYLLETKRNIDGLDYLSSKIKSELLNQIKLIIIGYNNYIKSPYPNIHEKIEVNHSRTDIEVIFYLLGKNKCFNNNYNAIIGKVVDSSFKYRDTKGEYNDIYNSRKHLNDFDSAQKGIKLSIARLKKLLTNPDFYNH